MLIVCARQTWCGYGAVDVRMIRKLDMVSVLKNRGIVSDRGRRMYKTSEVVG